MAAAIVGDTAVFVNVGDGANAGTLQLQKIIQLQKIAAMLFLTGFIVIKFFC